MKASPRLRSAAISSRSSCRVIKLGAVVCAVGGAASCAPVAGGGARSLIVEPSMVTLDGALADVFSPGRCARAMYLCQGNKDTLYRIHGTVEPWTIGKSVSSGCIRMINQDVIDLYRRAPVSTRVVVTPSHIA
jgi:hypothetical protein